MPDIKFQHIKQYRETGVSPPEFTVVCAFEHEILVKLGQMPIMADKITLLAQEFAERMDHHNWLESFDTPQVIYFEDIVTSEILAGLHRYLRSKCLCIENIWVIVTSNLGAAQWWRQWCELYHEQSYHVIDWPISNTFYWREQYLPPVDPDWDQLFDDKLANLNSLFSFYGGTYAKKSRCWMTLRLCALSDHGYIDFAGEFVAQQQLVDYVEHLTYFMNQSEVDLINQLYPKYVTADRQFVPNFDRPAYHRIPPVECIDHLGLQWNIDRRCFFSVARETSDEDHFATISEKTFRSFCHFLVPLNLGFEVGQYLENMGFWLPHDLVDFGYQTRPQLQHRFMSVVHTLEQYQNQIPKLQAYLSKNRTRFINNAKLALELFRTPTD